MAEKHQCAAMVYARDRWGLRYQCTHVATLEYEGKHYCKTHHPPTVKAKNEARQKAWNDKWDAKAKERKAAAEAQAALERKVAAYDRLVTWLDNHVESISAAHIRRILEGD